MPPEVADRVAAVALFGKPSSGFLQMIANTAPPITVGHLYAAKTTDMCIPEDPICSPGGGDNNAHNLYPADGLTDQAADFVAHKVSSSRRRRRTPLGRVAALVARSFDAAVDARERALHLGRLDPAVAARVRVVEEDDHEQAGGHERGDECRSVSPG